MTDDLKGTTRADIEKLALEISTARLALDALANKVNAAREQAENELELLDLALNRLRRRYETLAGVDDDET
jgi:hypothetical protein